MRVCVWSVINIGLENLSLKMLGEQRDERQLRVHHQIMQLETLISRWHTYQEACFTAQKNGSKTLYKSHGMSHSASWEHGEKMHTCLHMCYLQ